MTVDWREKEWEHQIWQLSFYFSGWYNRPESHSHKLNHLTVNKFGPKFERADLPIYCLLSWCDDEQTAAHGCFSNPLHLSTPVYTKIPHVLHPYPTTLRLSGWNIYSPENTIEFWAASLTLSKRCWLLEICSWKWVRMVSDWRGSENRRTCKRRVTRTSVWKPQNNCQDKSSKTVQNCCPPLNRRNRSDQQLRWKCEKKRREMALTRTQLMKPTLFISRQQSQK